MHKDFKSGFIFWQDVHVGYGVYEVFFDVLKVFYKHACLQLFDATICFPLGYLLIFYVHPYAD